MCLLEDRGRPVLMRRLASAFNSTECIMRMWRVWSGCTDVHADPSLHTFCLTLLMFFSIHICSSFLPERNHFIEPIPAPFLSRLKLACCWFESWRERCCEPVKISQELAAVFLFGLTFFSCCGWLYDRSQCEETMWGGNAAASPCEKCKDLY